MNKIRVSTVKYANSYPMNWGLIHGPVSPLIDIDFDHPAGIAARLTAGTADIGLVPVAAIPTLKNPVIIGNYCVGTRGLVRTVMLFSNSTIEDVETIWLDHRSVTSVNLAKVLALYHWKKEFRWMNPGRMFDYTMIGNREAIVIIGDQCFDMENRFAHGYDLASEWNKMTGLPFAFACWVAVNRPDEEFVKLFNTSLELGLQNKEAAVAELNRLKYPEAAEIVEYLSTNIDYPYDEPKQKALELFLEYMKSLNPILI